MSRPLRIEFPDALYHITSRGDRREDIYDDDADRNSFLDIFAATIDRFNWVCYAYCLMNNHYHLLIQTADGNLSKGMRQLNARVNAPPALAGGAFTPRFQTQRPDKHKAVSPHHRGGGEDYNESSYTTHWRLPCHFIAESIYIQIIISSA